MDYRFNEDQIDILTELINVGIGTATSNIAVLLDAFATIHIPKISICDSNELINIIQDEMNEKSKYYIVKQLFTGKFGGECMFVMSDSSANKFGNHLYGITNPLHDDINDAVMELTNILTSTIVSRLSLELETEVQFFVPSSQYTDPKEILNYDEIKNYSKIIVISTVLDFKDHQINGCIYILTKDEGMLSLQSLLDNKLKELYS